MASHPSDPRTVADTIRIITNLTDASYRHAGVQHELANLWHLVPAAVRQDVAADSFPRSAKTWDDIADACMAWRAQEPQAENHEALDGPSPADKALGLLVSDHGMTVTAIAKRVDCARSTLYRDPRFKSALEVLRAEQARPRTMPRGEKNDGRVEAW